MANDTPKSSIKYRPEIDGLRAVAVLSVVIFHLSHSWLPGGFVGVDVFFVISGYLITSVLLHEFDHGKFTLSKFYQRRIARLFPAFYTVALVTMLISFFVYSPQEISSCGANLSAAVLSIVNMKYMLQGSYFAFSPDAEPFLHYWSLAVEEQFYIFYPAILLLIYKKANKVRSPILIVLFLLSFLFCVVLTRHRPVWAFYLLPARAWELLAGGILANLADSGDFKKWLLPAWLQTVGLAVIAVSLLVVHEGNSFPGFIAALPVAGAALIVGGNPVNKGSASKILSFSPLVYIGRLSYSLYLWHWPIICFINYSLYAAPAWIRVSLQLGLSLIATYLCYTFVETPGRLNLNQPARRPFAYALLVAGIVICVPLGFKVHRDNYVNADMRDVAKGGLVFNSDSTKGSVILMGDSNGSMYGKTVEEIADNLGLKLTVLCSAAQDPLPHSDGFEPPLWKESLKVVKAQKPDYIIFVCNWGFRYNFDRGCIPLGVSTLEGYTKHLILITEPPELPEDATRDSIRAGTRPPFFEDAPERAHRLGGNKLLKSYEGPGVTVIDVADDFQNPDGSIRFADDRGEWLYQDAKHLAQHGADVVAPDLEKLLTAP